VFNSNTVHHPKKGSHFEDQLKRKDYSNHQVGQPMGREGREINCQGGEIIKVSRSLKNLAVGKEVRNQTGLEMRWEKSGNKGRPRMREGLDTSVHVTIMPGAWDRDKGGRTTGTTSLDGRMKEKINQASQRVTHFLTVNGQFTGEKKRNVKDLV